MVSCAVEDAGRTAVESRHMAPEYGRRRLLVKAYGYCTIGDGIPPIHMICPGNVLKIISTPDLRQGYKNADTIQPLPYSKSGYSSYYRCYRLTR